MDNPAASPSGTHEFLVPVVRHEDYTISYERAAGVTFVHVDVRRWTPDTAQAFRLDVATAHSLLVEPVYALGTPTAKNQGRFLAQFGFHPAGTVKDAEGRVVPIYERTLDGRTIRWWHHDPNEQVDQRPLVGPAALHAGGHEPLP